MHRAEGELFLTFILEDCIFPLNASLIRDFVKAADSIILRLNCGTAFQLMGGCKGLEQGKQSSDMVKTKAEILLVKPLQYI